MMMTISWCRLRLLRGIGMLALVIAPVAWGQQDMNSASGTTLVQPQKIITGPNRIESENTVTVKTGQVYGLMLPPSFCLLDSDCKIPTISLVTEYEDSPELNSALQQVLLNKYFYKAKAPESQEVSMSLPHVTVKTVYFGSADGYRNLLTINNRDKAAQDAKNNASDLVGIVAYILTKGASQPQGQVTTRHAITDKQVATLPAGPEKIMVTQVEFRRGQYLEPVVVHQALTAVYSDMTEQQLRKINFVDGVKPMFGIAQ
jgi:hypothetical protein